METTLFGTANTGAIFSDCRKYRYRLWRKWDDGPALAMLLLNPSKAAEIENDPTIVRQSRRAKRLGFGRLVVINAYAFIATDPADMKKAPIQSARITTSTFPRLLANVTC